MFHKLSRVFRFVFLLPVVFIPEVCYKTVWKELRPLIGMLCVQIGSHGRYFVLAGAVFLPVLIRRIRKVTMFTYGEDGQPVFLARIPVSWGWRISVRLPASAVRKMKTGQAFLRIPVWLCFFRRADNILIQNGEWQILMPVGNIVHFSIPAGEQYVRAVGMPEGD